MAKSRVGEIEQVEREALVIALRKQGHTFEFIASRTGYSDKSGAYQAFKRAMHNTLVEPAAELRLIEVMRLDDLLRVWWPKAMNGSSVALDSVLKIMVRRSKLLGLDAAEMVRHQPSAEVVAEIERLGVELGLAIEERTEKWPVEDSRVIRSHS